MTCCPTGDSGRHSGLVAALVSLITTGGALLMLGLGCAEVHSTYVHQDVFDLRKILQWQLLSRIFKFSH